MRNGLSYSEAGKLGGDKATILANAAKQQRIEEYCKNPKCCEQCMAPLPYEKHTQKDFCNRSCSAKFNNRGVRRHGSPSIRKTHCLHCQAPVNNTYYCTVECRKSYHWIARKLTIEDSGEERVTNQAKRFIAETRGFQCESCHLSEWLGVKMPLVLDHIDGNSLNHKISNLRLICNNCDALTPTYKGKNIGNGRFKRRQRYAEGKSY